MSTAVVMDGTREFRSQADAARWLLESWGVKPDAHMVATVQPNISKCVCGRQASAYGHVFRKKGEA